MNTDINDLLQSVEWDFADTNSSNTVRSIHPYPARFIPDIPRALIRLFYPEDGSAVLDPFCGCGTTLVEASSAGIPAIGIDLHPLATLIAKVKTTPIPCSELDQARRVVISSAKKRLEEKSYTIPAIPRLNHWFEPPVQMSLASLIEAINEVDDVDVGDALKVAFSSIVVRVSNQDSDTRYAAVKNGIESQAVLTEFEKAVLVLESSLDDSNALFPRNGARPQLITKDVLQVEPWEFDKRVGLVITSPPYPNAYEYWLYHKYRMYWLGMDPVAVRELEIGARPHYFKKNPFTEKHFETQMSRVFWLLSQIMQTDALACMVIGRSIIRGRVVDNELLLERAATANAFSKVGAAYRNINIRRKSFNPANCGIDKEAICIFRLELEHAH